LDKLAKLKDKKKGKSKEEITKDTHDLKELLQESNLSDTDLATLLTDFTKSLHADHKDQKVKNIFEIEIRKTSSRLWEITRKTKKMTKNNFVCLSRRDWEW